MRPDTALSKISTKKPLWKVMRDRKVSADQLLRHFNIIQPPVDVEAIAKELGVRVTYLDDPGWSGAVQVSLSNRADIWIASDEPHSRQRFTLAHELGHLMRHDVESIAYRDVSFSGNREELEANDFAAALLMPLWMVQAEVDTYGVDVRLLAYRFDVSEPAMSIRLDKLTRW